METTVPTRPKRGLTDTSRGGAKGVWRPVGGRVDVLRVRVDSFGVWIRCAMNCENNPILTANAQKLRSQMTKEERKLWYVFLKTLPVTVNRQKVLGPYILDFYCASAKTAIELDGSQHYEDGGRSTDEERDQYLKERGITVLRYSNRDVNQQFKTICEDIENHLIGQPRSDTTV